MNLTEYFPIWFRQLSKVIFPNQASWWKNNVGTVANSAYFFQIVKWVDKYLGELKCKELSDWFQTLQESGCTLTGGMSLFSHAVLPKTGWRVETFFLYAPESSWTDPLMTYSTCYLIQQSQYTQRQEYPGKTWPQYLQLSPSGGRIHFSTPVASSGR